MNNPLRMTAKQKAYAAACQACLSWADAAPAETLAAAQGDRLARSYGIEAGDAARIIKSALTGRGL